MCLENISKKKIAKRDITVWKVVNPGKIIISNIELLDGKEFTATIYTIKVKGKISIEDGNVYFCTDNSIFNVVQCKNRHGYKYSWHHNSTVRNLTIDNIKYENVYKTYYKRTKIFIGKEYKSKIKIVGTTIEIGLHSFCKKKDIFESYTHDLRNIFVKCIIPKGSVYYTGTFKNKPSIASKRIRYVKVV